jgi:hypothetical protein
MLAAEFGELGRLGDATLDVVAPSGTFDESVGMTVKRGVGATASCVESDILGSCMGITGSLPEVDCLEGKEFAVGVGETAAGKEPEDDFSGGFEVLSTGEGNPCTTLSNSLFVRTPADCIIGTSCAKLGRIANIRRGVKGTMISCTNVRNSASHRKAVDC